MPGSFDDCKGRFVMSGKVFGQVEGVCRLDEVIPVAGQDQDGGDCLRNGVKLLVGDAVSQSSSQLTYGSQDALATSELEAPQEHVKDVLSVGTLAGRIGRARLVLPLGWEEGVREATNAIFVGIEAEHLAS